MYTVYILALSVYSSYMNTTHKEKRIDEVTLDEAFNALNAVDYISDFKRRNVGPVSEWTFTVREDATALSNTTNLIIHIPAGVYTLVREEATRNWVTLMLPEDFNE